jgi:hypothetical protein
LRSVVRSRFETSTDGEFDVPPAACPPVLGSGALLDKPAAASEIGFATASGRNIPRDWPAVADIPAPGSRIPAGAPVSTVFADGASEQHVQEQLDALAAQVLSGGCA